MKRKWISSSIGLIIVSLFIMSCGSQGSENQGQASVAPAKMTVTVKAGLVSLDAQNAPLGALLDEIGRHMQISISMPEEMKADRLTLAFYDRSLEEALRQVLAGQSYSFLYRQEQGREVIAGVRLVAQQRRAPGIASSGTATAPPSPVSLNQPSFAAARTWGRGGTAVGEGKSGAGNDNLTLDELKRSLTDSQDPAQRTATLDAIANWGEDGAVNPILAQALTDGDQGVRETALNLLKSSYDPVPIGPLASMAALDANPEFRMEAMTLMTDQLFEEDRPKEEWATVSASLSKSLTDPDQDIRDQAEQLLSQLAESGSTTTKHGFGRR